MSAEFQRRLPKDALSILAQSDWWRDVLDYRFRDASGQTQPLFLAIRNNYLNVYVEGQSLFEVRFQSGTVYARIHHKFVYRDAIGQDYLVFDGKHAGSVRYEGRASLHEWAERARSFARPEKQRIAIILGQSANVIDVEMGLPGVTHNQIDLVALEVNGSGFSIVFYEAKRFANPELRRIGVSPNVREQIGRYRTWLEQEGRREQVIEACRNACNIKLALHDAQDPATRPPLHPFVRQVAEGASLTVDTEPRLVIFDYNQEQMTQFWVGPYGQALRDARITGHRLLASPIAKTIYLPEYMPWGGSFDDAPQETRLDEAEAVLTDVEGPEALNEVRAAAASIHPDLRGRLEALAAFAPVFRTAGFRFADWHSPPSGPSGITSLPVVDLSEAAQRFVCKAYEFGWVKQMNWSDWMKTPDGQFLCADPKNVINASHRQLEMLVTVFVRSDRFNEGALKSAFDSGFLTAIVSRAEALLASLP